MEHVPESGKHVLLVDSELSSLLESACENVEEHLTVGVGVDVTMRLVVEVAAELMGIDEVSILPPVSARESATWYRARDIRGRSRFRRES